MKKGLKFGVLVSSLLLLGSCGGNSSVTAVSSQDQSSQEDTSSETVSEVSSEDKPVVSSETGEDGHVLGSEGLEYTLSDDETYYILTGIGTCTDTVVTVGNWHEGLPVKEIGEAALSTDKVTIDTIIVSEGITTLGFRGLRSRTAKHVYLPDGIKTLTKATFILDKNLESIVIGKGLETIEDDVFMEASPAVEIYFRGSREEFAKVNISLNNNTLMSQYNFHYGYKDGDATDGKVEGSAGLDYTLSDDESSYTLTSLGTCTDKDVVIGNVHEGKPVTSVGERCLTDTAEMDSLKLSYGINSTGFASLAQRNVKLIDMPNGITTYTKATFIHCEKLETLIVGKGLTAIEDDVFFHDLALKDIYFRGTEEEWKAVTVSEANNDLSNVTIHYGYIG